MWKPCTKVRKSKASKTVNAVKAIFRNTDTARYYCKNIVKGLPKPITHIKQCWSPVPWPLARHQLSCRTIRLRGGGETGALRDGLLPPSFHQLLLGDRQWGARNLPTRYYFKTVAKYCNRKVFTVDKMNVRLIITHDWKKWLKWLQSRNLKVN